eukprot:1161518-Pelagomonas_calceolata.AAC.7
MERLGRQKGLLHLCDALIKGRCSAREPAQHRLEPGWNLLGHRHPLAAAELRSRPGSIWQVQQCMTFLSSPTCSTQDGAQQGSLHNKVLNLDRTGLVTVNFCCSCAVLAGRDSSMTLDLSGTKGSCSAGVPAQQTNLLNKGTYSVRDLLLEGTAGTHHLCDLDLALGNEGAGDGGSQQVGALVQGVGPVRDASIDNRATT